jgi:hypothetical protein
MHAPPPAAWLWKYGRFEEDFLKCHWDIIGNPWNQLLDLICCLQSKRIKSERVGTNERLRLSWAMMVTGT